MKAFNTGVMRLLREDPERLRASGAQVFLASDDAEAKLVAAALAASTGLGAVDLGGLEAAWLAETMADAFRQAMMTTPAGWRQALVFADLGDSLAHSGRSERMLQQYPINNMQITRSG